MITLAHPTTARHSISSTRSLDSPTMDGPKQGVLRLKSQKENVVPPSALPRLSVRKDANQTIPAPVRKVSGSQPTLGAAALRTQVDTLRAENAKLRKEHQRELAKLQEKSAQSESRVQELVREKLNRDSEKAEVEREHRMAAQREAALRTALERSEAALKQLNERTSKVNGVERKLEDMERIHNDEKRKLTLEISSLQSQLDVARTTMNEHSARLRERDTSKRFESRARELEARLQERESRLRELEEELATAEAQAEVYEGRVQVYDKRVRAYKERVRIAEAQAREFELEIEALQVASTSQGEASAKELEYTKGLLEKLAVAYGELHGRMQSRDREVQSLEWALWDKGKQVETLQRTLRLAEEERRDLMEELGARRVVDNSEWRFGAGDFEDKSRAELDELLVAALDGQREARVMELQRVQILACDLPQLSATPTTPTLSLPSSATSTGSQAAELELARLRAECAALREEQESLEQDLVDAAMDAEEHARQAGSYQQLQIDYANLEAELSRVRAQSVSPNTSAAHAKAQADLARLESEHQRLEDEFASYKQSMEETARAKTEHEARAVLLNGLQAREHALREQMDGLRAQIARLERALSEERVRVTRAEERLTEARAVEKGLRGDMEEMMEALDRVDRYEEAYETLVGEVVQLGLGEDELDRLQKVTEDTLNVSTSKQKMRYVDQVKAELDRMAQKLAQTEFERDQARAQGADLRRELGVFQTVTGLNGWTNPTRSSSTPPVRSAMTPPARAPSMLSETEGPRVRPELRALGLGLPPARPTSAATTSSSGRTISRALSLALEAENMSLTE